MKEILIIRQLIIGFNHSSQPNPKTRIDRAYQKLHCFAHFSQFLI